MADERKGSLAIKREKTRKEKERKKKEMTRYVNISSDAIEMSAARVPLNIAREKMLFRASIRAL